MKETATHTNPGKKIAIIGAGWTGIGCLRVLSKETGFQVDVYEQKDAIGGTWHPDNNYAGLKLHTPALTIEYYDFPLPESIDRFERLYSANVFQYLDSYCDHHQFKKHMHFNKYVKAVSYNSITKKSKLRYIDENSLECESSEYDFVIYTHGYCENRIPAFKNSELFQGKFYHSSAVSDNFLKNLIRDNKKIILIGGGKTATDFIIKFYDYGYKVHWLVRKPYWFFSYNFRKNWLMNKNSNFFYKSIFIGGLISSKFFPALSLRVWSWFGLVHTYGKRHYDFKKFHFGMLDKNQIAILKQCFKTCGIVDEITEFESDGVILQSGKILNADVVICCTGSGPKQLNLGIEVDQKNFETTHIKKMYRSRVIPQVPNLIFTAYHQFSMGTIDGLLQGNWIKSYIQKGYSPEYLASNTTVFQQPFFSKSALFDSENYIISAIGKMYYPFFSSHEIPIIHFLKCFLDANFNGNKKIIPFEFKFPKNN